MRVRARVRARVRVRIRDRVRVSVVLGPVAPGEPVGERGDALDVRREADAAERLVEAVEEVAHLGGGRGGVEGDQGERDGLEVGGPWYAREGAQWYTWIQKDFFTSVNAFVNQFVVFF